MKEVTLDCRGLLSRNELHQAFSKALSLPDHYGNNLDALHDCLAAIAEETRLTLLNWDAAEEGLGRYVTALKRVLTDAEAENPRFHVFFS